MTVRGRRRLAAAVVLAAGLLAAGCGDDGGEPSVADLDGRWDVVLVVGAAVADPAADASGFPGEGSDAAEPWSLACDDDGCVVRRQPGGLLGALDGMRLDPTGDGATVAGSVEGVRPPPSPEASPCTGSPAETWTVEMELTLRDDVLVGSVFRIPDALVDGGCYGLDLTLGLSGVRRS